MVRHPLLVLLALFALASCQNDQLSAPETLVVSVLPDQSREELTSRFAPLMSYLEATTGQSLTLVLADDYATLLQSFIDGEVHLAFFGGATFVQAEAAVNADPLVMRDTDIAFRSCYVTRDDDPRSSLEDYRGGSFSFGSSLSTSGHLMPRYFMQRFGVIPEQLFSSIEHSRTHFETAQKVVSGSVEIGVMNCSILEEALSAGTLSDDQIRILAKTPAYVNYTWAIQDHINEDLKTALVDAFLALDIARAEHEAILMPLRAHVFLPAGHADFEDIRRAVLALSED
ncbi:MAG: phosphate/phosphite/phosphonate ABC transporter substrate-binding protein [Woeseiaceae bacterium]|nr:phosphate/phosphite/phosphonate ABC transporter substrate-binding protein [Woeseiaceae bacterium]